MEGTDDLIPHKFALNWSTLRVNAFLRQSVVHVLVGEALYCDIVKCSGLLL